METGHIVKNIGDTVCFKAGIYLDYAKFKVRPDEPASFDFPGVSLAYTG